MNYVISIFALIIFLYIQAFSNLDLQYYKTQEKFYTYLKLFDFDRINNDLISYSTCERNTVEGTTRLWYCLFPNQKRELFIPNYDNRTTSFNLIRTCWTSAPNCKQEVSDNWFLYYKNWTIIGCQYWVEAILTPNVAWLSNWDIYTFSFKSIYNNVNVWFTKSVSVTAWAWTYTSLTAEALIRNALEQICVWWGAAWKCISPDINISTTIGRPCHPATYTLWNNLVTNQNCYSDFNNFSYYLSDDKKSLLIWLKNKDYQVNLVNAAITDWNPVQGITDYWIKKVLNKCGN